MAWLAVDSGNFENEFVFEQKPYRTLKAWNSSASYVSLPKGTIKKLIGKELTWIDEAVEIF